MGRATCRFSDVDAVIDRAIEEKRIVGTVVMGACDGEVLYERAAGWADRDERKAMAPDTVFRYASLTKPVVTVCALGLVEQGLIALDDRVSRFLPYFTPRAPDERQPEILIHHLLSHSAGLSYRFQEPPGSEYHSLDISDGMDLRSFSLAENMHRLAKAPLAFLPGTSWRYSLATDVLGAALEEATQKPLPQLVFELVTGPLAMPDAAFAITDTSAQRRMATAYYNADPEPKALRDNEIVHLGYAAVRFAPSRIFRPDAYPSGGSGMAGTAKEFLRFLEAVRNSDSNLLTRKTWSLAMHDHVGARAETQGPGWGFGYGWALLSDQSQAGSPQSTGTLQWGGAYGHSWFVDRESGLSVVALTNTLFEGMAGAFPKDIRDAFYASRTPTWS